MGYHVEIGASNTVKFENESLDKIHDKLNKYNSGARCSIVDLFDNTEIYYGTVELVQELLGLDLASGEIDFGL